MREILPKQLVRLAENSSTPVYVVGGSVRDYLAHLYTPNCDWDICAPISAENFACLAKENGFSVRAVYKNTGTVKLSDMDGVEYEYTSFRSDKYVRGTHVPVEIFFTDDIRLDATRRDFTANAVYYDVKNQTFVDPLDGITAIKEKRLTTVCDAKKVFSEDGLRLMRLARQGTQLGFTPDENCLQGASLHAHLIGDISPERIFSELTAILHADEKYGVKTAPYDGLHLLEKTGVLAHILPELALGKGMSQRADFHNYDVLEHTFRAVLYSKPSIRLASLLHDVGKPLCQLRDGNVHAHPQEGATLANAILSRLKAPNRVKERVCALVQWHMYDMNCMTRENKLRRFFVTHTDLLQDLIDVKQADFSACTDDLSTAPTVLRWTALLEKMRLENVPFSLRGLAVNGNDLLALGIEKTRISQLLQALLLHVAIFPNENEKTRLLHLAKSMR